MQIKYKRGVEARAFAELVYIPVLFVRSYEEAQQLAQHITRVCTALVLRHGFEVTVHV